VQIVGSSALTFSKVDEQARLVPTSLPSPIETAASGKGAVFGEAYKKIVRGGRPTTIA
jgi:hypothetical protein